MKRSGGVKVSKFMFLKDLFISNLDLLLGREIFGVRLLFQ